MVARFYEVSEESFVSFFRRFHCLMCGTFNQLIHPKDGGSNFLRYIGTVSQNTENKLKQNHLQKYSRLSNNVTGKPNIAYNEE